MIDRMNTVNETSTPGEDGSEITEENCKCVLQPPTRFSESILWDLMKEFYKRNGVEAWSKGIVPFFITCNAFIAKRYAQTIHAYVQDLLLKGDLNTDEPIYIIELGAAAGKFSFLLLKAVLERLDLLFGSEDVRTTNLRFKYIMTDFTDASFQFWAQHGALKRYFHRNILDYAVFDAEHDESMKLVRSQEVIGPGTLVNPPIIVANYLFDSLPADSFQIRNGKLFQGCPAILTKTNETNRLDPEILNRFHARFYWDDIDETYEQVLYKNESETISKPLNCILSWYKQHFNKNNKTLEIEDKHGVTSANANGDQCEKNRSCDASFLLPIVSFRCLDRLARLCSTNGMLVISGDKGTSQTSTFLGLHDPHIAVHGSFSLMVNYHSIGLWFDAQGGFSFQTPQEEASLKVAAFVLPNKRKNEISLDAIDTSHWSVECVPLQSRVTWFHNLHFTFADAILSFSPDDFFYLQKSPEDTDAVVPKPRTIAVSKGSSCMLKSTCSLLQLSDWDPDLFFKYREILLDHLSGIGIRLKHDVMKGLQRTWSNYFLLDTDKDIAFEIGRVYYGLQDFERALLFYSKSCEQIGRHHVTEHNMGLCHFHLGSKELAKEAFERAIGLNPNYSKAKQWLDKMNKVETVDSRVEIETKDKMVKGKHQISIDPAVLNSTEREKVSLNFA